MKKASKALSVLLSGVMLFSCGSDESAKTPGGETTTPAPDTATAAPDQPAAGASVPNERGLELIGSSDCTTCHGIDKKIIGPSYVDVAKKYEATDAVIDTLVSKIKKGGMGNWGNIPMTPHPDLPDADAKEMVKYILSLKNQ